MFKFFKKLFGRKAKPVPYDFDKATQKVLRNSVMGAYAPAHVAGTPVAEQSPEKKAEDREVMLRLVSTPYRLVSVPVAPAPLAAPATGSTAPRSAPAPASRAYSDSDDYFNPANPLSPNNPINWQPSVVSVEPVTYYDPPAPASDYSCPAPSPSYDPPPCSPSPSFDFGSPSPSPDSSSW